MKKIKEVAKKLRIKDENLIYYGEDVAKIKNTYRGKKKGKLILVTSINPTPYGEGKTTLSIGLNDSLNKIGKKSIAALREPSLGPVFGRKGGAIGGGKAIIEPSTDINLHFTGDFHAITSANNLLCAIVDNHIFQGNELGIDRVNIKRCLDVNDRTLRENFVITTASELMAIFCLATDLNDLKRRIGNIIVGFTKDNKEIYARDLHAEDACTILLKNAINPNLVQTLYGNPVIVHGGPFANIAHGCNSIIATKIALSLSDYVITEAGFGSDMGAVKFFDIKCKENGIYPEAVVLNCTIKALKYNGEDSLEKGIGNLEYHIKNMAKYTSNLFVALNKFNTDTKEEIEYVSNFVKKLGYKLIVCSMFADGEDGCIELAEEIIKIKKNKKKYYMYDKEDDLFTKINKVCKNEYGAGEVVFSELAKEKIEKLNNSKLNICISKTPMSITDNPKVLGYPKNFTMTVDDINLYNGAGFITILLGGVLTMPGLAKESNYLKMKIDEEGNITGIR